MTNKQAPKSDDVFEDEPTYLLYLSANRYFGPRVFHRSPVAVLARFEGRPYQRNAPDWTRWTDPRSLIPYPGAAFGRLFIQMASWKENVDQVNLFPKFLFLHNKLTVCSTARFILEDGCMGTNFRRKFFSPHFDVLTYQRTGGISHDTCECIIICRPLRLFDWSCKIFWWWLGFGLGGGFHYPRDSTPICESFNICPYTSSWLWLLYYLLE